VNREGYVYGGALILAGALVTALANWFWALPIWFCAAFVLYFFRDPERPIPADPDAIVSPADGKVTTIQALPEGGEFRQRISIFLSVFDVHVNRTPIGGKVTSVEYCAGQFRNALSESCAAVNERNTIRVEDGAFAVEFVQIAGLIARRIVCRVRSGQTVARGQRIGMIKFGSRTDLYLPAGIEAVVSPGEHVLGGSSVVARKRGVQ
jgi:phosphatidylserine decarboxylase